MRLFDENFKLHKGRCFGSKSGYSRIHPMFFPIFNANIVVKHEGILVKVWHGDIDLSLDLSAFEAVKNEFSDIYVLRENDCRFDNVQNPRIDKSIISFKNGELESIYEVTNNRILSPYTLDIQNPFNPPTDVELDDIEHYPIKMPSILVQKYSNDTLADVSSSFLLDNINLVGSVFSFYHDSVRDFAVKEYMEGFSWGTVLAVDELLKKELSPLQLIQFLFKNKKNEEYLKLLKKLLFLDSFYIQINEELSNELYVKEIKKQMRKKFTIDKEVLMSFRKVGKKGSLKEIFNLLKVGHIKNITVYRKLISLLPSAFEEAESLILDDIKNEENLYLLSLLLNRINSFGALKLRGNAECPRDEIWLPTTRGIIF